MAGRPFDIVVFGATGDAGRAVAAHMAKHAPSSIKWAIAGRSMEKLAKVEKAVLELVPTASFGRLQASCDDAASMTAMTRITRLVLSAAGPYTLLGEPVILACLAGGAHYADITGEVDWVGAMKQKYDAQARDAGITLCSFCGYDCVPDELSVFFAEKELPPGDALRTAECVVHLEAGAGMPRGTIITMLTKAGSPISFAGGIVRFVPPGERLYMCFSLLLWLLPRWSPGVKAFTVPHFMGWCNTPVVHSSCAARRGGATAALRFQDRMLLPFSDRLWTLHGLLPICAIYITLLLAALPAAVPLAALAVPSFRDWVVGLLQSSYSYPGDTTALVTVHTRATSTSGKVVEGVFKCPGDPGIHCTALLIAETSIAMVESVEMPAGFTTPAIAVGDRLAERLRAVGGQAF